MNVSLKKLSNSILILYGNVTSCKNLEKFTHHFLIIANKSHFELGFGPFRTKSQDNRVCFLNYWVSFHLMLLQLSKLTAVKMFGISFSIKLTNLILGSFWSHNLKARFFPKNSFKSILRPNVA